MRIGEPANLIVMLAASSALFAQNNDFPVVPDARQAATSRRAHTINPVIP